MRKKRSWIMIVLAGMLLSFFQPMEYASAEEKQTQVDLVPHAKSAILMDADSGTVMYEKNAHDQLPPASITKIMSMLLIMEAIDEGKIGMDDMVMTSEYASSMGGSQIFLEPGEQMSVRHMLMGIAMASGNDATVAMAEKIAGSEEMFVNMMNEKSKQLGLANTHFANTNGLPANEHYSSAHDIAVISRELLKYEHITTFTGKYQDYLRQDSDKPFWLVNTNKLVRFYPGADGLKTGYTSEAKFCLAATAKRKDFRIIAVVLGEPNTKTRNAEVSQLFDYAFAQYENVPLYQKGEVMGTAPVRKGQEESYPIIADQRYSMLLKKGQKHGEWRHDLEMNELNAPIHKGDEIGKLVIRDEETVLKEFPLYADHEIGKAGWWKLFKRSMKNMIVLGKKDEPDRKEEPSVEEPADENQPKQQKLDEMKEKKETKENQETKEK
ncbi:D-alanyl-D-alanine carboxypeptidase family protein [Marinicrinis sediminis]|uniref:serine-type D-Ala-D-Ala carboxypeptidase n=1 Tax=Marinicrinis sediminis TaxID=1652465 RepID=A0ABW5RCU9_9BACL